MSLKFTIHMESAELIKTTISTACSKAEHVLAIQVAKDTAPFVPALTGSLTQRTKVDGSMIIYPGPYARFLYYGKVMVDPNTGSTYDAATTGMIKHTDAAILDAEGKGEA